MSRTLPEIYALPSLSDRVVMNIVDALIANMRGRTGFTPLLNRDQRNQDQ
jgi:hypothetical protein